MISPSGARRRTGRAVGGEKHKRYIVPLVFRPFEHTNTFSPTLRDTGGGKRVYRPPRKHRLETIRDIYEITIFFRRPVTAHDVARLNTGLAKKKKKKNVFLHKYINGEWFRMGIRMHT